MGVRRGAIHGVLQSLADHLAPHAERHEAVLERQHLVDVAEADPAPRQPGADAAVVDDAQVRPGDGPERIGDQSAEGVVGARPLERESQGRHRATGEVLEIALVAFDHGGECGVRRHLVDVGGVDLDAHVDAAAAAHEIGDGDSVAARSRLDDGDAVHSRTEHPVGVPRDDQVDRAGVEPTREVEDLAVAGAGIAHRTGVSHHDHDIGARTSARQRAAHGLRARCERQASDVARRGGRGRARGRESDHRDFEPAPLDQLPRFRPIGARGARRIGDVRGHERIARLLHPRAQRVH